MIHRILLTAYIVLSFIYAQNVQDGSGILSDKRTNNANYNDGNDAPDYIFVCGTAPQLPQDIIQSKIEVDAWLNQRNYRNDPVNVYVIFHVIHASNGQGDVSDAQIENQIELMNDYFNEHLIFFILDSINRVENDIWFENWDPDNGGYDVTGMQALSYDPYHYLNIYTASLNDPGSNYITGGYTYLPMNMPEGHYQQGFTLDYRSLPGGAYNWPKAAVHEAGHYFGLYHTFETNCNSPDDAVDDTPRNHSDYLFSCNPNLDSCPDDPGNDPVDNHMTYSGDSCPDHFTVGQGDRMHAIIAQHHPSLLDNNFFYPSLYVAELNYQLDTDGDGVFNPGETVRIRANVGNSWGVDAEGVALTLTTADNRLTVLDSVIEFANVITPGEVSFTLLDWFEVYANEDAGLGNIPCTIHITSSDTVYPYENIEETFVELSLNQYGYPTENYTIKSSPIIADLDGNGLKEIYFGSDNGSMYATMIGGLDVAGFPFETNDDVRSSPAVGDVDGDGQEELVFGSKDGNLYIVSSTGSQEFSYNQSGYIIGAAALANLDGDNDLEIVFATQSSSNGKVFAIHHDGSDVTGFPVDIAEKVIVGPAVADLENDGVMDIVAVSWDNHIHVFDANGAVKTGFPFETSNRFNSPATLVDLDGDGDLEIAAGNDNGNLYVLHHDATIMAEFDTGDDIRGGITVADLDGNGSLELLFTGYDDHVHVWDPVTNTELAGWPVDIGSNSLTGPVAADLDNDGDLEVVTSTKSGNIHAFHHDGIPLTQFPFTVAGNVESTPAIGDLDNDGDFELIFGTTMGLQVIDVKSEAGEVASWKLHRGNRHRSGYYGLTLAAVDPDEMITPLAFHVSRNYPNPFNPITTFRVTAAEQSKLEVSVYDVSGRLVNRLINDNMNAGIHTVQWDGRNQGGYFVPTGVYFLQVISGENQHMQKMALIK